MYNSQEAALNFLKETETDLKIRKIDVVCGFPNDDKDTLPHSHYKITLARGGKSYTFDYYGSYYDYQHGKEPVADSILAALQIYDVGSMADFVDEYGYVIKDRKSFLRVERIWKECKKQYSKLKTMYNETELDKLAEIQ